MPGPADLSLDASYAWQSSQLVIRNTFLEVEEPKQAPLRRCTSGSDLSCLLNAPLVSELKQWSEATSQTRSNNSIQGSEKNTPRSLGNHSDDTENDVGKEEFQGDDKPTDDGIFAAPALEAVELIEKLQAQSKGRSLPEHILTNLAQDDALKQHIPVDPMLGLTSFGSILHGVAPIGENCRPCVFLQRKRCSKDWLCIYCHLPHETFEGKRLRPSKRTRMRRVKMYEEAKSERENEGNASPSNRSQGGYSTDSTMGSFGSSQGSDSFQLTKPPIRMIISL